MRTLTDMNNRTWNINLTMGTALKVDQAKIASIPDEDGNPTTVQIMGQNQANLLKQLMDDYTVCEIACVLIQDQLQPGETAQEVFLEALRRDKEYKELATIIADEFADFFPEVKTLFGKLVKARSELMRRSAKLDVKAGNKIESEMETALDKAEKEAEKLIDQVSIEEQATTTP